MWYDFSFIVNMLYVYMFYMFELYIAYDLFTFPVTSITKPLTTQNTWHVYVCVAYV